MLLFLQRTIGNQATLRLLVGWLLEFGEEDAEIKRRLRFELAGEAGAEVIAADITKRLAALRRLDPSSIGSSGEAS